MRPRILLWQNLSSVCLPFYVRGCEKTNLLVCSWGHISCPWISANVLISGLLQMSAYPRRPLYQISALPVPPPTFLNIRDTWKNQLYGHLIFHLLGVNYSRISTGDCSLFSVRSLPVSFIWVISSFNFCPIACALGICRKLPFQERLDHSLVRLKE